MRINFENDYNININSHNSQVNTEKGDMTPNGKNMAAASMSASFLVSFGDTNNDLGAYDEKKSVDEMVSDLTAQDVKIKRDYMSVMSLSMSDEDYANFVRTGETPDDMDVTDTVTIMDDIKAALIKGGTNVTGYTDDIDSAKLEEITGSVVAANELIKNMHSQDVPVTEETVKAATEAIKEATSVLPLTDSATKYLIENGKTPTVQNVYQAAHAGVGREVSASSFIEDIRPQIEEIIKKSGLENSEKTLKEAEWLINKGIGLTPENLLYLDSLSSLHEAESEEILHKVTESVTIAMGAGIAPRNANLIYTQSVYTQAQFYVDKINMVSEASVDKATKEGKVINLNNLEEVRDEYNEAPSPEMLKNRRILEEARLHMTVEANRLLLKSNFRIDIAPMEELVDALKLAEKAISERLFAGENDEITKSRAEIYRQTRTELPQIPYMPVAIIGKTGIAGDLQFGVGKAYSLHDVYTAGINRREEYAKAGESYEALMTTPRADMGDSIKKAFRNVDDILDDLKIEINDDNRRAVRILGYNSMEITSQSITQIREADIYLRDTLNRLTPSKVLSMIRDDINPLNMTVNELRNYLDAKEDDPEKKAANYARFLMQLERQDEITELERESYIGIYRMINSLEKTDDAAIGSLIKMGTQTTFANLLSAMRSAAKTMDYKIGDDFGGVESLRTNPAIDEQIGAAFSTESYVWAANTSETMIEELLSMNEPVSVVNLDALEALKHKRGDWFRPISLMELNDGELESEVDDILEGMQDTESAIQTYDAFIDGMKERLQGEIFNSNNYLDVRALQSSMRQMSLLQRRVSREEYDIPTQIEGNWETIRLQINRGKGEGKLTVSMEAERFGKVIAEFNLAGKRSGYIAFEKADASEKLGKVAVSLEDVLGFIPEQIHAPALNLDKVTDTASNNVNSANEESENADINNTELYRIARGFIGAIRRA